MAELLDKLKRRLKITGTDSDALLTDMIEDAENYVKGYTGRDAVPALCTPAVLDLAAGAYNQLGLEGEKSHSEGGISVSLEALPEHMKQLLNRYRIGVVSGP